MRFRLSAAVAIGALGFASTIAPALAEVPLPPALMPAPAAAPPSAGAPDGPPPGDNTDPPARVGRLAGFTGQVSYHSASDTTWLPASVNYPVTSGDAFWTQPDAQARIEVSDTSLVMAPATELDVGTLDDQQMLATEPQGEIYVQIAALSPGETYRLETPRGTVSIAAPGEYEIAAGDTQTPTQLTVVQGEATMQGPGLSLSVGPGQTAQVTGDQSFAGNIVASAPDPFLTSMLAAAVPPAPPPPVAAQMSGAQDLGEYGTWSSAPEYGTVWYPRVAADWVPYREGHWAYVSPWGWTWIDNEPWGFAPFHYGRWVSIGGRWGWAPGGPVAVGYAGPPVYAPALVAFIGIGAAVGITAALLASHPVGWVPLGWREPYRPWYHASPRYLRQVNITRVTNITTINRNVTFNNFANRRAATVVPAAAMTGSRPVGRMVEHVSPAALSHARPVFGRPPVRPSTATLGITPHNAQRLGAVAAPHGVAPRPAAPGPAIHPAAAPGRAPALRSATGRGAGEARPGEVRPGEIRPGVGGPVEAHPGAVPALARHEGANAAHPGATGPAGRPNEARPGEARPGAANPARPGGLPALAPHGEAPRPTGGAPETRPGVNAARPEPQAARPETTRPETARPETARPENRSQAARPEPVRPSPARPEAARPEATRPEAARPQAARPEAVHPAPQASHPAPRPEPRPEPHPAPRPAPHPEPRPAPHPAPHPAPAPHPQPEHRPDHP